MTIWVCYYEYEEEEFDNCSHPVCFYHTIEKAEEWRRRNGENARVQEMEDNCNYLPR